MQNTKRPVESFIVAKASTTYKVTGALNNNSTGNATVADGQIGMASVNALGSAAAYTFLATNTTIDVAPVVAFFQGNANSASVNTASVPYPLAVRAYEKSSDINGRTQVVDTYQAFREGQNALHSIGDLVAGTNPINAISNTEYGVTVAFYGRRHDERFGYQQRNTSYYSITTPDFEDASGTAIVAKPIDYIVNHLGFVINRNSFAMNIAGRFAAKDPIVAIAVGESGGTAISGLTVGGTIAVMTTTLGTRSITITQPILDAINAAATALAFTHIHTIDLTTAGLNDATVSTGLWLLALDEPLAFEDYVPQRKVRLEVGLTQGFTSTVKSNVLSKPDEGQGHFRPLELMYKATQGQRKYNLRHTETPIIEYPSPFVANATYSTFIIHHGFNTNVDTFNVVHSPLKEIICIPSGESTMITALTTGLNSWLASGDNQAIITP